MYNRDLMTKIKIKTIIGLTLATISLYILNYNTSAEPMTFTLEEKQETIVNENNLLGNIRTVANNLAAETNVISSISILDEEKTLDTTTKENIDDFSFLDSSNLKIVEDNNYYIVEGKIEGSKLDKEASDDLVDIVYYFDKDSREFIRAESVTADSTKDYITDTITSAIASEHGVDKDTIEKESKIDVSTKVVISQQDNTNDDVELSDKSNDITKNIEDIASSFESIILEDNYKRVTIDDAQYIIGESVFELSEDDELNEKNEVIIDDIIYTLDKDTNVILGISFNWLVGSYLDTNTLQELTDKLGEPITVGNSNFWEITALDQSIIICATDEYCEVFLR